MCEFGTSPAAQSTEGEAGKMIRCWGTASTSVQDDTKAATRANAVRYLVEKHFVALLLFVLFLR
jgi:hypothetical protein